MSINEIPVWQDGFVPVEAAITIPLQLPPIDFAHWSLAVAPLVLLLILLVGLRWQAQEAGPVGMFVAALIALVAFQTPWNALAIAAAKGIWDSIFILYVVWPALLLYHVVKRGGGFIALQDGIQQYSDDELFLVLAFGWVFTSFLQGISGFGTPIAVVAPILIIIGVKPVYAVVIPLIGHAWGNLYGGLAVAWLATIQIVDLSTPLETAVQSAILLFVPIVLAGLAIAWLYGRTQAVRHGLPMILIIGTIHGGVQLGMTFVEPILSAFLASTIAMLALYPLSRWERYDQPVEGIDERPAMHSEDTEEEEPSEPVMGFGMSLMPYAVLTIVAILALLIPQIQAVLDQFKVGVGFPTVETGYGLETEVENTYNPFTPLTHPGTFLSSAVVVGWIVYRFRGYYDEWAEREDGVETVLEGLFEDAVPASLAIVVFLVMAQVMDHAGQVEVLAIGIAAVSPPIAYAFISGWIGFIGAFMTSSNTSSNILFAPLQEQAADQMDELLEATIIAGQNAGGSVGNSIAPANVVLGTGTAGIAGQEGDVIRKVLPWAALVMVIIGILTIVLNGLMLVGGG